MATCRQSSLGGETKKSLTVSSKFIFNGICHDELSNVPALDRSQYISKFIPAPSFDDQTKIGVSMDRLHKKKGFDHLINAFGILLPQSSLYTEYSLR